MGAGLEDEVDVGLGGAGEDRDAPGGLIGDDRRDPLAFLVKKGQSLYITFLLP
jgi:hypothetical protein